MRARFSKSVATDSVKVALGTALSQLILLAATPLLGRLYSPEAFGAAAPVLAIVLTLSVVATGRYELAVLLPRDRGDAASVVVVCGLVSLIAGAAAAVGCLIAGVWYPIGALAWALPVGLVLNGLTAALGYWMIREGAFGILALSRVAVSLLTVGIQLLLAVSVSPTATGLIVGHVGGPVALVVLATLLIRRSEAIERPTWSRLAALARAYRKFPLVEAGGALIGTLGTQIPVLLLAQWFSDDVVGQFSMASRLVTAPVSFMGSAVGQVFFQRASARAREGAEVWSLARAAYIRLVLFGLGPLLIVIFFARPLMLALLGDDWGETGFYAQVMAAAAFFQLTYAPLSTLFAVRQRYRAAVVVHTLICAAPLAALVTARVFFPGSSFHAVVLLGAVNACMYFGLSMWNLRLARTATPFRPHPT